MTALPLNPAILAIQESDEPLDKFVVRTGLQSYVSEEDGLILLSYNNQAPATSDPEIDWIRRSCHGLILDTDRTVVSVMPPMPYTNLSNRDLRNFQRWEDVEGTMLRQFFYKGKWYTSTRRRLDANKTKWLAPQSFGTLYRSVRHFDESDLDENVNYTFLLKHPSTAPLPNGDTDQAIYFVDAYNRTTNETVLPNLCGLRTFQTTHLGSRGPLIYRVPGERCSTRQEHPNRQELKKMLFRPTSKRAMGIMRSAYPRSLLDLTVIQALKKGELEKLQLLNQYSVDGMLQYESLPLQQRSTTVSHAIRTLTHLAVDGTFQDSKISKAISKDKNISTAYRKIIRLPTIDIFVALERAFSLPSNHSAISRNTR